MFKIIINFFKRRQQKKVLNRIDKKEASDNSPKKETDPYITILSDSTKRIDKLKIYKNYFNHILLDKIIMQSETIHNIFESNKELKYNKLEQFHYYYTDHLIELLDKIKSNKEESKSMLETQMNSYEDILSKTKYNSSTLNMTNDLLKFERSMSILLSVYYNILINNVKDNRYEKTKLLNISKYADFAWNLSKNDYEFIFNNPIDIEDLVKFDIGHTVRYFSKELLTLLNKNLYDIKYQGFFKNFDRFIYLFKIKDTETYFSVDENSAKFLIVEYDLLKDLMVDTNTDRYVIKKQLEDVHEKISEVKLKLNNLTVIDKETEETLVKYYEKIENVELLESFNSIDMERKNLETILKLEQLSI